MSLLPCKYLCIDLIKDEKDTGGLQLVFENVEVQDDGQRLLIKDGNSLVAYNMSYVISYTAQAILED